MKWKRDRISDGTEQRVLEGCRPAPRKKTIIRLLAIRSDDSAFFLACSVAPSIDLDSMAMLFRT